MKQHSHNLSFFKILFLLVFVLAFGNKLSATTTAIHTNLITTSFSINNLNDEDLDLIESISINLYEECEEEEKLFNGFLAYFNYKDNFIKGCASSNQHFKVHLISSRKKRFYILYCQLKTHL